MSQPTSPSTPAAGRRAAAGALVLAVALLTGCGVRAESPAPTEPVPDAAEASRRAAVTDVVDVRAQARASLDELTGARDSAKDAKDGKKKAATKGSTDTGPAAAELEAIIAESDAHLTALGGVYVSGLTDADGTPHPPEPSPAAPASGTAAAVERLAQAYSRTRGALASQDDDGAARLMASIAVAQLTRARELANASGTPMPETEAPASAVVPSEAPERLDLDVAVLVLSEDNAGYAYEVAAPRLADGQRVAARARAAEHRARAEAWARLGGIAGTAQDPRRVAYAVPAALLVDIPDLSVLAGLETTLATGYATLVGSAGTELRVTMLDLLGDSYAASLTWGANHVPFPGLPEALTAG